MVEKKKPGRPRTRVVDNTVKLKPGQQHHRKQLNLTVRSKATREAAGRGIRCRLKQ